MEWRSLTKWSSDGKPLDRKKKKQEPVSCRSAAGDLAGVVVAVQGGEDLSIFSTGTVMASVIWAPYSTTHHRRVRSERWRTKERSLVAGRGTR